MSKKKLIPEKKLTIIEYLLNIEMGKSMAMPKYLNRKSVQEAASRIKRDGYFETIFDKVIVIHGTWRCKTSKINRSDVYFLRVK